MHELFTRITQVAQILDLATRAAFSTEKSYPKEKETLVNTPEYGTHRPNIPNRTSNLCHPNAFAVFTWNVFPNLVCSNLV